jgi:hypothetical protein
MPTRYKMMLDKLSLKTANPQPVKRENITIYFYKPFFGRSISRFNYDIFADDFTAIRRRARMKNSNGWVLLGSRNFQRRELIYIEKVN